MNKPGTITNLPGIDNSKVIASAPNLISTGGFTKLGTFIKKGLVQIRK